MRYVAPGVRTPSNIELSDERHVIRPKLRWLMMSCNANFVSSGTLSATIEEQSESVWRTTLVALEQSGMTAHDIVKLTQYLISDEHVPLYSVIREKYLKGATPASTLLILPRLQPSCRLVEIEIIAAKDDPDLRKKQ
ncbi:RidA family protein [Paraburkholderia caledonica]|uniref:RidA family protein n=1 Tax=Paraburkholderia caledonica TaxID=134536 RepID=UPI0038B86113